MIPWLALSLGAVAAVELAIRLSFRDCLATLRRTVSRVAVTFSSSDSERRKQEVLAACSRRMLANSVALFLLLLAVLLPFSAAVALAELASTGALELAVSVPGITGCALFAAGYAILRKRVARLFPGSQAASSPGP